MKVLKKVGLIVCILILVAVVGVSVVIGNQIADALIYQNEGKDTKEASVYQLEAWEFSIESFEEHYTITKKSITSEDGVIVPFALIGGELLSAQDTVILVHGLGGDFVSVYPQAEMYLKNNYNVIAIDQRASGESLDDKVSFGYFEKLDIKAVVDYINSQNLEGKIIVHGFSMGGATAGLYAGTDHANQNVDGVIMDSSFESLESVFKSVWDDMNTGLPYSYAVWCGDLSLKTKHGFGFDDADASKALESCEIPVLVIQSEQDDIAPIAMGQNLYDSIQSAEKEIWLVDTKHIEGYIDFPVEYEEKVFEFLNK
ncbi:MAG: alpha/beta hydrolase [Clostridiales bacterium]|nr:alpha/beta hydrolase [Clostridiales bacterium]